jgi:hypothetical protein
MVMQKQHGERLICHKNKKEWKRPELDFLHRKKRTRKKGSKLDTFVSLCDMNTWTN